MHFRIKTIQTVKTANLNHEFMPNFLLIKFYQNNKRVHGLRESVLSNRTFSQRFPVIDAIVTHIIKLHASADQYNTIIVSTMELFLSSIEADRISGDVTCGL